MRARHATRYHVVILIRCCCFSGLRYVVVDSVTLERAARALLFMIAYGARVIVRGVALLRARSSRVVFRFDDTIRDAITLRRFDAAFDIDFMFH